MNKSIVNRITVHMNHMIPTLSSWAEFGKTTFTPIKLRCQTDSAPARELQCESSITDYRWSLSPIECVILITLSGCGEQISPYFKF